VLARGTADLHRASGDPLLAQVVGELEASGAAVRVATLASRRAAPRAWLELREFPADVTVILDVLHTASFAWSRDALGRRSRPVVIVRGSEVPELVQAVHDPRKLLLRTLLQRARPVLVTDPATTGELERNGIAAEAAAALELGDLARFTPAVDLDALHESAPDQLVLGCVAPLEWGQGHATLLEALATLVAPPTSLPPHTLRLHLLGRGPLETELRAQATNLGIAEHVTFFRGVPPATLPVLLRGMHGLVHPSLPHAVAAALASGVPVVGTRLGSVGVLLRDGFNGIAVPPSDPTALAAALCRLRDLGVEERTWMARQAVRTAAELRASADREVLGRRLLRDSGTHARRAA
jgi:glycosyltransferase involved in cell wall biosynthesis